MVTEIIKLLPCPFCGAEAQFRRFGVGNDLLMIECANPYGACCRMSIAYTTESERMLADRWNRHTKPMSDELRKAIDEIFEEGESEKNVSNNEAVDWLFSDLDELIDFEYGKEVRDDA